MNHSETAPHEVQLPARFQCGASYQWRNGGGYLTIAPGMLVFEFNRLTQKIGAVAKVVHVGDSVTSVRARLLPPGINTGIIVRDEIGAVQVSTWFRYRRVRAALLAADFEIEDVVMWISCGERLARVQTQDSRKSERPHRR